MLTVNLTRLTGTGTATLAAAVPPDYGLWEGTRLEPASRLQIRGEASTTGGGGVVVRGAMTVALRYRCRRCLEDVLVTLDEALELVFEPEVEEDGGADDRVEVYPLDPAGDVLELEDPIREQLMLAAPRFVVCRPHCEGLCPRCGVNLNEESCDCTVETGDPRWDALRALTEE